MSKKLAIPLIIAAFIIGVVAGGWCVSALWGHLNMQLMTKTAAAEAGLDVAVLKELRANNDTNAIGLLETRLDSSVMELGYNLNNIPQNKRDPQDLQTLQIAKSYREKYPHPNPGYPIIDQMVSNAFLLVSAQPDK